MPQRRSRRAFTLVELLVALMMMAVAAAGLASALTNDRRLRDLAAAQSFGADRARERLELLAALPCISASSGKSSSEWGTERWSALPWQSSWHLTDSLALGRSRSSVVIEARVACPD